MKIRAEHLTKKVPTHDKESTSESQGIQGSQDRQGVQKIHGIQDIRDKNTLTILHDVSLTVDSGETLAILGVSGSGKSTLLGLLAGLDLPSNGKVYWDDINITEMDEDGRAKARLERAGFIFQNFELLSAYTTLENVMLPLELMQKKDATAIAKMRLSEVGLEHRLHHYPNQLSGGEQQRVAIARAFAIKPAILFADEPTGNLDQKTGSHIIKLIFELNKKHKTTIICVTHDPALSSACNRTLHIAGGELS